MGGLFAALGVGSIVLGLTLQNSVGQIISGLLLLFEQPFQIGDWVATRWIPGGRVVEVNWRATHLDSGSGVYVLPNSLLASEWFINLSVPRDQHSIDVVTTFATTDAPDQVCAMLNRVAGRLPQLRNTGTPDTVISGAGEFTTTIPLWTPADDAAAKSVFLSWTWYASRRALLHLDGVRDDAFPGDLLVEDTMAVVGQTLRVGRTERQLLLPNTRIVRFGTGETVQAPGEVPKAMTFVVKGRVRVSVTGDDGSTVAVRVLERGDYLGQTTLTREPVASTAYALDEVTVAEVERAHIEALVMRNPTLLQDMGRVIDERRANVRRALSTITDH